MINKVYNKGGEVLKKYFNILLLLYSSSFLYANEVENPKEVFVGKNVKWEKYEKAEQKEEDKALVGVFAISGNSIVFKENKGLKNDGQIYGFLEVKGEETFDNSLKGAVSTDGQGNGVASTAFSSFTNKRDLEREITSIQNKGVIAGGSDLSSGDAEVHGSVESVATGNGILAYGVVDYGVILGSDGAGGSSSDSDHKIDGKGGASVSSKDKHKIKEKHKDKHKEKRKHKEKEKHKHKNKDGKKQKDNVEQKSSKYKGKTEGYYGSNLDGKAGASGGSSNHGKLKEELEIEDGKALPKIDPKDFTGKSAHINIKKIENLDNISGDVSVKTADGYQRIRSNILGTGAEVEVHNQPQWRSISVSSSGNGVSAYTFVTSPTRQNFSTEKENEAKIGEIINQGNIEGSVDLEAGNYGTLTYVSSYAAGNGVSLSSYSDNNVGHKTITQLEKVKNTGMISGKIAQKAGENTSSGWHEYSDAKSYASANGISLFSRSANARNETSIAKVGDVENSGVIQGELLSKAGAGNGQILNVAKSSGNGMTLYVEGGKSKKEVSVNSIKNKGVISGKAVLYGGKDAPAYYAKKEEKRFHVDFIEESRQENGKVGDSKKEELKYQFTEEEKKNANALFLEKQKEVQENRKKKIVRAEQELKESEETFKNQREAVRKEKDLLLKINKQYVEFLEKEEEKKKQQIHKKEEDMKWVSSSTKEKTQKECETLKKELANLHKQKELYKKEKIEDFAPEVLLAFYDNNISKLEEKLDTLEEEKKTKLKNKGFMSEDSFKQQMEEIEKKRKDTEAKIKEFETELKEEKIQSLLALSERRLSLKERIEYLKKLQEQKQENPMDSINGKNLNHKQKTIQTMVEAIAAGNGISIQHDSDHKVTLGSFENEGVISGYTEVYRGTDNQEYQRVKWKGSGAGVVFTGEVDTEIKNTGIISGNEFALLSKGKYNRSSYGNSKKFESGFKKVSNYGILAGRVIIGGYEQQFSSQQDYDYFETIYTDKNKYNNLGLFLVLNKKGEVENVIKSDKKESYEGKEIINLAGEEETYREKHIKDKIVNAVGKKAAILAETKKESQIENSVVNAFYNAAKIEDGARLKIKNSVINTNGFGEKSFAVIGDDGKNELHIQNDTAINGKIDLGKGDDYLILEEAKLLFSTDLGEGENTLVFDGAQDDTYYFSSEVYNANMLQVNRNIALKEKARITNLDSIDIQKDRKMIYYACGKENQPFTGFKHYEGQLGIVHLRGDGTFLLGTVGEPAKMVDTKKIYGWKLLRGNVDASYVENEKMYEARNALGLSFEELKKMSKGKEINMYQPELILSHIYQNPYSALKYATLKNASTYYRSILDGNFIPKKKISMEVQTWKERKEPVTLQSTSVLMNYGVSDRINIAGDIGTGKQSIKLGGRKVDSDTFMTGLNVKFKNHNFVWTNGVGYLINNPKNGRSLQSSVIYTEGKYEFQISDKTVFLPKISFMLGKALQKEEYLKIEDKSKKEIGNIIIPKEKYHFAELNFAFDFKNKYRFGKNMLVYNFGAEYSIPRKLLSTKIIQTEGKLKNEFTWESPRMEKEWYGFVGSQYQHENGFSFNFKYRRSQNKNQTYRFGIGYLF